MAASRSTTSSMQPSGEVIISLHEARSGDPYATAGAVRLHSSYDPRAEAERFVRARLHGRAPSMIILLGDTLPYVRQALRTTAGFARRVLVFYVPFFYEAWLRESGGAGNAANEVGFPAFAGSDSSLRALLDGELTEQEAEGLLVLEWPQSAAASPDLSKRVNAALAAKIREVSASLATSIGFSRLWVRNGLRNLLSIRTVLPLPATSLRVVIAASGPSLRRSMALLRAFRRSLCLLALPSSFHSLVDAGLLPDLVLATDPGFWARLHLSPLRNHPEVRLAMPLTAAAGPQRESLRVVLFSEGSFVERELLASASMGLPLVPPGGTVASTAVLLAEILSGRPPVFAGLDLAFDDIREHVSPHAFELYLSAASSRLHPYYSQSAQRALDQTSHSPLSIAVARDQARSPRPFLAYGAWLTRLAAERRIYRLFPEGQPLEGMVELSEDGFVRLLDKELGHSDRSRGVAPLAFPTMDERRMHAGRRILDWRTTVEKAARGCDLAGNLPAALSDRRLAEILWALAPQGFLRARRFQREDSDARARDSLRETTTEVLHFLSGLEARYLS